MTEVRDRMSANERVMQAPFVLLCSVDRVGASAIPILTPSDSTAIARVERAIRSPDALGDLDGRDVTVEFAETVHEGERFVLFAEGAMYGETIAVRELRRMGSDAATDLAMRLNREDDEVRVRHLADRARRAAVVVRGTVRELRAVARGKDWIPTSEHDPDWWIAVIDVRDVGKGRIGKQGRVQAVFANSRDVQWYDSPKPAPGQHGVFLLHRARRKDTPRGALVLLDPADVQPPEHFEDVRRVVEGAD